MKALLFYLPNPACIPVTLFNFFSPSLHLKTSQASSKEFPSLKWRPECWLPSSLQLKPFLFSVWNCQAVISNYPQVFCVVTEVCLRQNIPYNANYCRVASTAKLRGGTTGTILCVLSSTPEGMWIQESSVSYTGYQKNQRSLMTMKSRSLFQNTDEDPFSKRRQQCSH